MHTTSLNLSTYSGRLLKINSNLSPFCEVIIIWKYYERYYLANSDSSNLCIYSADAEPPNHVFLKHTKCHH